MKNKENGEIKVCPKCGTFYKGPGALSRKKQIMICPDCGTREALESIGVSETEQEKILDSIHKCCIEWD